jgi:hypothetical protein
MWEGIEKEKDKENDRRRSQNHYNQRGKAPPVILQPPVRVASEIERDRRNRPGIKTIVKKLSNIPEEVKIPSASGPSRKDSSYNTYRVRDHPPPPRAESFQLSTKEVGIGRWHSSTTYRARGGPPPPTYERSDEMKSGRRYMRRE